MNCLKHGLSSPSQNNRCDELVSHKNVQKKNVNNRKAGKKGAKSDMLCDAFLTTCLAYRFARCLDYNMQNQIDSLYKFILENNPIATNNINSTLDRCYKKH